MAERTSTRPAPLHPLARRIVWLLTLLVVVDYADRAVLGAVAPAVREDLSLSLTDLGLLGASFGIVGGVATVVAGVLVDRVPRLRVLGLSALGWALAMVATGAAQALLWLLLARAALSLVLATVGPAYPSLVGDAVPHEQRGRALSRINSGQLVGGALGVLIGALAVLLLSWRWAFWSLALPAALLAWSCWRTAEPGRRGAAGHGDVPLRAVVLLLLRTPTALLVVLSAAVSSYYLAGASSFSVVFAAARYDVSTPVADLVLLTLGLGGLAGILVGGRLSDHLAEAGRGAARLRWAAAGYVATAVLWLPALFARSLTVALPCLLLGSAALAATLPALDAVRVDVVPPGMRGRAESVRTVFRVVAEGAAPLAFGVIASGNGGDDEGLQAAFLLALPGIVLGGVMLLRAAATYDADRAAVDRHDAVEAGP